MIKSDIQIEDGQRQDFAEAFGFIYLDADERTAPDEKEDAVTNYAGEHGEHRDGRTCYAPFDYTAKFAIEAKSRNLDNVNVKIDAFNEAIRGKSADSDVMRKKQITFYNLLNRCKIVGYPELVAKPTKVYHSRTYGAMEYAIVELKIRVSEPNLCDFKMELNEPITLSLSTDGTEIAVNLSRELVDNEMLLLLTRGAGRSDDMVYKNGKWWHGKSKYRWHIRYRKADNYGYQGLRNNLLLNGKIDPVQIGGYQWESSVMSISKFYGVWCRKANHSHYFYMAQTGLKKGITFGVAVYKINDRGPGYRPIRMSNVAYFKNNVEITDAGTDQDTMKFRTWYSV